MRDKMAEEELYKRAFNVLMEYWDSLNEEQHDEINTELNKIFPIGHYEHLNGYDGHYGGL